MTDRFNIRLEGVGKKFYKRWLFKEIHHDFQDNRRLALVGHNGSGKSTLIRIIAGQMAPSEGKVSYSKAGAPLSLQQAYQYISWSGPYIDLYEDLTFPEMLELHFTFKECLLDAPQDAIELLQLGTHSHKPLKFYSSGMMQRAKVGLALFSKSEVLILDEPTSNMDAGNASRMLQLVEDYLGDRIFVLASNLEREYGTFEAVRHLGASAS
ncbi:ATP-binding cassette domain-containing protein [Pontibacter sp. G13]|uniref:ABC transporter ATP-binding protein n=1 Tax=Pontibacter sp. G13 TaxID=3074898 RepID=UPI00288AD13A|nr:ATP-binding cassette domain-containing protein [Pontibacter sp. G13]WNJ18839.1 ATP-binding cassette domain-containing protein [Pontibacter sp. G13]